MTSATHKNGLVTSKVIRDGLVRCNVPVIGHVQLYRFHGDHPAGRPWHITTFGMFRATVEECLSVLQEVADNADLGELDDSGDSRPVCHGEMTHSFLATEAALDAYPY